MTHSFSWKLFEECPVVGILRGFTIQSLPSILEAVVSGGLTNLEITMNTPEAALQIHTAAHTPGLRLNIGAGTVTDLQSLDFALDAGATFIVTPLVQEEVILRCVRLGIPVFPGALTPTEVCHAADRGANMVKIFPAESRGPAYVHALKEEFPEIKLMPTGGVDLETIREYISAGADAFGVGSPLFDRRRVGTGDWNWLRTQAASFRSAFEKLTL